MVLMEIYLCKNVKKYKRHTSNRCFQTKRIFEKSKDFPAIFLSAFR